jgi:tRNA(fMet)-specific endonuclease VapC
MRQILIDSSVVIASFRNDAEILGRLATVQATITTTVLGELFYGAAQAARIAQQIAYITGFTENSITLVCDAVTASYYGNIKNDLRRRGMLIPDNDIWIAASALQHHLPLATHDAHFERVPGLMVEQW